MSFSSALQDALDIGLGHRLTDLPVNDGSAGAVENRAEVVERAGDVEVGHVNMPVFMRSERLNEAGALLRRFEIPAVQQSGPGEDSIHARWAGRSDVLVDHHEGQTAIALERETLMEGNDGLALLVSKPMISRNEGVVFVGFAVPFAPCVELPPRDADPTDEAVGRDFRLLRPISDEVDDRVSCVMGNPATRQRSPSSFFRFTYSAEISAITPSFLLSRSLSRATSAASFFLAPARSRRCRTVQRGRQVVKRLPLPRIKETWLNAQLVAQLRYRHLLDHVAPKNIGLLLGGELTTGSLRLRHDGSSCRVRNTAVGASRSDRGGTVAPVMARGVAAPQALSFFTPRAVRVNRGSVRRRCRRSREDDSMVCTGSPPSRRLSCLPLPIVSKLRSAIL